VGLEVSALETPRNKDKDNPQRMPGHRIVVETDSHGEPVRIIRRHSSSHHGRHHHRHWDDERADITNGELANMRERERLLLEANDSLARENHNLKVNLDQAERSIHRHQRVEAQLRSNVQTLAVENGDLRRSLEAYQNIEDRHQAKTQELRHKITRLENENEGLRVRIRELTNHLREAVDDRVRSLREEINKWRRRWEDLDRRYTKVGANLDAYIKENQDLKEENAILLRQNNSLKSILRRHHLI
jgi:chromosome segregation ATPase